MDRRIPSAAAALVLAIGAVLAVFLLDADPDPAASEASPGGPGRKVTPITGAASDPGPLPTLAPPVQMGAPGEVAAAERGAPLSPAEEGLFALADAAGESIVRCDVTGLDVPDLALARGVRVGDQLTLAVGPNDQPGVEQPHVWADSDGHALVVQTMNAFPGTMGKCRASLTQIPLPSREEMQAAIASQGMLEKIGVTVDQIAEQAEQRLDDVDAQMSPEQIALETEGLSEGARAWLQARLDGKVEDDEDMLDALDPPP